MNSKYNADTAPQYMLLKKMPGPMPCIKPYQQHLLIVPDQNECDTCI